MNWELELLQHFEFLGLGEIGVDMFRHHMPYDVKTGILLAQLNPIAVHEYAPKYYIGSVQIVARAGDVDSATLKANSVIDAIGEQAIELESVRIIQLKPSHLPLPFPLSEGNLVEASVNFDIRFMAKTP